MPEEELKLTAQPSPAAAASITRSIVTDRIAAGQYLLRKLSSTGLSCKAMLAEEKLPLIHGSLSGEVCAFIHSLSNSLKENDIDKSNALVESFLKLSEPQETMIRPVLHNDPSETLLSVFRSEATTSVEESSGVARALPDEGHTADAIRRAFDELESSTPELNQEILNLVGNICPISSPIVNAGSSWHTYGTVFLRQLEPEETWTAALGSVEI